MKKITLIGLFLLLLAGTNAQENDIKKEILSYKESEYDFVNKGRRLLIDNLQSLKLEEAIKIKDGLLKEFDGNVAEVFYAAEYIHLLYWTREFDVLLNYIKQVDLEQPVSNNVRISGQTDDFFKAVYGHTIENKDILEIDIKNWELSDMDRDFLLLLLKDIADSTPESWHDDMGKQIEINAQADRFLANYPGSPYETLIRENIRFVFKESDNGAYIDFGLGSTINQGGLSKQFTNGIAVDISLEYRHRKLMGILGFGFSGQKLKQEMEINNTVWKKDASATLGNVYMNAGYLIHENRRWSIYPFAGVGYTGYSAVEDDTKEDKNLKKLGLNSFYVQMGAGFDLKIKSLSSFGNIKAMQPDSDSRISLKYIFRMPKFDRKDPLLSGSQHVITLSYGFGGRGKERDL